MSNLPKVFAGTFSREYVSDIYTDTYTVIRYLALRLCAPNLRKTTRKADLPPPVETPRNGQIFKGDKEIVGYIIAEWDMKRGVLFLALVIPWVSSSLI
jgi:hypothetical protein